MNAAARLLVVVATVAACARDTIPDGQGNEAEARAPAAAPATGEAQPTSDAAKRIEITVTEDGFTPDPISVPRGKPMTLVFTRTTDKTCATEVIMEVGDNKIEKPLPLNKPVEIAVTFPKAGKLRYACAMDMVAGVISVE